MNDIMMNILSRRSTRAYKPEQIEPEHLDMILKAGLYAPSGSNSQSWHFLVIQDQAVLKKLNEDVRELFLNWNTDANTYKAIVSSKQRAKRSDFSFYYEAPTLVVVSNERDYSNGMADSACALENMFLAAHSLSIGSCWINQLTWLKDNPDIHSRLVKLGMPETHTICGSAALGYAAGEERPAADRKPNRVTYVR